MLQHVALEMRDENEAALFFTEILALSKLKSMTWSSEHNKAIFGNDEALELLMYGNEHICVEVFLTGRPVTPTYRHLCLSVADRETFVSKCRAHRLTIITAQKGGRQLLFVRDFSGNLYEIKESPPRE